MKDSALWSIPCGSRSGLPLPQSANQEGDIQSLDETDRSRLPGGANTWQTDILGAGERRWFRQCAEIVTPDQQ